MSQQNIQKIFTKEEQVELLKQLGKISPQWSQYLLILVNNSDFIPHPEHLNLYDPKIDIVGEAYGFSGEYAYIEPEFKNTYKSCKVCAKLSNRMVEMVDAVSNMGSCDELYYVWEKLENFIEHWNKVHKK